MDMGQWAPEELELIAGAKIKCNKITGNIITHNSDAEGGGIIH